MYKNKTVYDLELILRSQRGMLMQTRIVSAIFSFVFIALGITAILIDKVTVGVCLLISSGLILILFVGLSGLFLKLQMKKNLSNRQVFVEYIFGNNLTISSSADGQVVTQSFDYNNIFQMIEENDTLIICPSKNDALIMRLDKNFYEYKNFIKEKMNGRYIEKAKKNKIILKI